MPVIIKRYHLPVPIIAEHLASQGLQATVPQECIVLIYELSSLLLPRIPDGREPLPCTPHHPDRGHDAPWSSTNSRRVNRRKHEPPACPINKPEHQSGNKRAMSPEGRNEHPVAPQSAARRPIGRDRDCDQPTD